MYVYHSLGCRVYGSQRPKCESWPSLFDLCEIWQDLTGGDPSVVTSQFSLVSRLFGSTLPLSLGRIFLWICDQPQQN